MYWSLDVTGETFRKEKKYIERLVLQTVFIFRDDLLSVISTPIANALFLTHNNSLLHSLPYTLKQIVHFLYFLAFTNSLLCSSSLIHFLIHTHSRYLKYWQTLILLNTFSLSCLTFSLKPAYFLTLKHNYILLRSSSITFSLTHYNFLTLKLTHTLSRYSHT